MKGDAIHLKNKKSLYQAMQRLVETPLPNLDQVVAEAYHSNAVWNGSHPLNAQRGVAAIAEAVWRPLRHALPDVERRDDILLGGHYQDADWVGIVGNYVGTFENDLLDIPSTGGVIYLRYGEFHHMLEGKIAESYVLIDFLDLMRQAGFWPIAPSLGTEGRWPGPATNDGVLLSPQDPALSETSIQLVLQMHAGLFRFDQRLPTREVLDRMGMVEFWHPYMMWYGPSGIGTTRGLKGFEDYHQVPFLIAFPDRKGAEAPGGHLVSIGDGHYAATGGWPSLAATHKGGDWLGLAPTGKRVTMRVMDFYRCEGDLIVENWVPIDIIDVLRQLGVDVFGRMRHQFRQHDPIHVSDWLAKG